VGIGERIRELCTKKIRMRFRVEIGEYMVRRSSDW